MVLQPSLCPVPQVMVHVRVAVQVKGAQVYSQLKYESGVHRVQRVRCRHDGSQCSHNLLLAHTT